MITCKEDMRGCYALRCDKGVFELFMDKCEQFGIKWAGRSDEPRDCQFGEAVVFSGTEEDKLTHGSEPGMKMKGYKRLTLSDLKPRTKVEYEKVEYNHAWEIVKLREEGVELFKTASDELKIERINAIALRASSGYDFYRKVEHPVEWWEDPASHMAIIHNTASVYNEEKDTLAVHASMTRDQWCDFARILLEQEGE